MNINEKFVITINRELGSGGRTVGRLLSEKLGVPYYDKALIKTLEEKYNLTAKEIETLKGRKHNWWSDFERITSLGAAISLDYYKLTPKNDSEPLTTKEIFKAETEILNGIAENGSCVIAGRAAFYVFRNHPNHLSILIQASKDHRIQRVMDKQGLERNVVEEIVRKVDKMRENYVQRYTGTSRYDTRNYNLVISMDGKTEEEVAKMIIDYIGQ